MHAAAEASADAFGAQWGASAGSGGALPSLAGEAHLGACDVDAAAALGPLTIGRLVAEHTDDVYRLLHRCLGPLGVELGAPPYAGRIHARASARAPTRSDVAGTGAMVRAMPARAEGPAPDTSDPHERRGVDRLSGAQLLRLIHLCDSGLPTGGFAHSGGLEAAAQLGVHLGPNASRDAGAPADATTPFVRAFAAAAAGSACQLLAPFALAAFDVAASELRALSGGVGDRADAAADRPDGDALDAAAGSALARWADIDSWLHAHLAANGPACRASLQQGRALARLAATGCWADASADVEPHASRALGAALDAHAAGHERSGHGAAVLGALGAILGLPRDALVHALAYATARDLASAAVRLGLIGPMAAVRVQADASRVAAAAGASAGASTSHEDAAGGAPLVEALHPCHDLLDRRIFQT